jgi:hypothetical protein
MNPAENFSASVVSIPARYQFSRPDAPDAMTMALMASGSSAQSCRL